MYFRELLNNYFFKEDLDIDSVVLRETQLNPNQDLFSIQRKYGLDAATMYFYRQMLGTQRMKAFRRIMDEQAADFTLHNQGVRVLVVGTPATIGDYHKNELINQWQEMAMDAGFRHVEEFTPTTHSMLDGALQLQSKLKSMAVSDEKILLVSFSHGSGFVRFAVDQTPKEDLSHILAWINISGLVFGSPLYHCSNKKQMFWARQHHFFRTFSSEQKYFIRPISDKIPAIVSFLGCRLSGQMAPLDKKQYLRLRHWGPNDGLIPFRSYERMPGFVVPLWGQGHAMNFLSDRKIFQKTMCYLVELSREQGDRPWKLADLSFVTREKENELQL